MGIIPSNCSQMQCLLENPSLAFIASLSSKKLSGPGPRLVITTMTKITTTTKILQVTIVCFLTHSLLNVVSCDQDDYYQDSPSCCSAFCHPSTPRHWEPVIRQQFVEISSNIVVCVMKKGMPFIISGCWYDHDCAVPVVPNCSSWVCHSESVSPRPSFPIAMFPHTKTLNENIDYSWGINCNKDTTSVVNTVNIKLLSFMQIVWFVEYKDVCYFFSSSGSVLVGLVLTYSLDFF